MNYAYTYSNDSLYEAGVSTTNVFISMGRELKTQIFFALFYFDKFSDLTLTDPAQYNTFVVYFNSPSRITV